MIYLGIDPGKTGALAIPDCRLVEDMPNGPHALLELLSTWPASVTAVIERQQAMPVTGRAASFVIGEGYGIIQGVLAARRVPYRIINAATWKRQMGLTADKEMVRAKARELFPWAELHLKKHEGRAHALMLAEWGRRFA